MKLATCGSNGQFELGTGVESRPVTTPVEAAVFPENVEEVVCAYHFTTVRLADGTVVGCGGEGDGELGDNSRRSKDQPVSPLGLAGPVKQIDGDGGHVIALHVDGTVSTWGGNAFGQIGNGTTGEGVEMVGDVLTPVHLALANIGAVCAGGADCYALGANGVLLGWGANRFGQIGDGTKADKLFPTPVLLDEEVVAVAAGGASSFAGHTLAVLASGKVVAWGQNAKGQSGQPAGDPIVRPAEVLGVENAIAVAAGVTTSLILLSDRTMLGMGVLPDGRIADTPTPLLSDVSFMAGGLRQVLAVVGGQVLGCGYNKQGELGDGTREDKTEFVEAHGLDEVRSCSVGGADGVNHSGFVYNGDLATTVPVLVDALVGGLRVYWAFPPATTKPWAVKYRLRTWPKSEWTHAGQFPPDTRSVTLEGLASGSLYEVWVSNGDFGWTIVRGTPR